MTGCGLRPPQPAIVAVPPLGLCFTRPIRLSFQRMRHDLIDRRSLELNRLVAEKIRRQPELMDLVRGRLDRTVSEPRLSESCKDALREWQVILSTHSLNEVLEILTEDSALKAEIEPNVWTVRFRRQKLEPRGNGRL